MIVHITMEKLNENIKNKKDIEKDILRKEKFVIIRNEVIKNLKNLPLGGRS